MIRISKGTAFQNPGREAFAHHITSTGVNTRTLSTRSLSTVSPCWTHACARNGLSLTPNTSRTSGSCGAHRRASASESGRHRSSGPSHVRSVAKATTSRDTPSADAKERGQDRVRLTRARALSRPCRCKTLRALRKANRGRTTVGARGPVSRASSALRSGRIAMHGAIASADLDGARRPRPHRGRSNSSSFGAGQSPSMIRRSARSAGGEIIK